MGVVVGGRGEGVSPDLEDVRHEEREALVGVSLLHHVSSYDLADGLHVRRLPDDRVHEVVVGASHESVLQQKRVEDSDVRVGQHLDAQELDQRRHDLHERVRGKRLPKARHLLRQQSDEVFALVAPPELVVREDEGLGDGLELEEGRLERGGQREVEQVGGEVEVDRGGKGRVLDPAHRSEAVPQQARGGRHFVQLLGHRCKHTRVSVLYELWTGNSLKCIVKGVLRGGFVKRKASL